MSTHSVSSGSGSEDDAHCGSAGNVQFQRKFSVTDYSDVLQDMSASASRSQQAAPSSSGLFWVKVFILYPSNFFPWLVFPVDFFLLAIVPKVPGDLQAQSLWAVWLWTAPLIHRKAKMKRRRATKKIRRKARQKRRQRKMKPIRKESQRRTKRRVKRIRRRKKWGWSWGSIR